MKKCVKVDGSYSNASANTKLGTGNAIYTLTNYNDEN